MAYSDFRGIRQVIQIYPLQIRRENFLSEVLLELPDLFIENLNFALENQAIEESEAFFVKVSFTPSYSKRGNAMKS